MARPPAGRPLALPRPWAAALALALCLGLARLLWPAPPPGDRPIAPLPQGPAPLAITAFGTSLTARYDWPEVLAARLERGLGRPVRVSRVARVGAGSAWALEQVGAVAATRPDLVLLEFAVNDADLSDGVGLAVSVAQHEALLRALAEALPEARVALLTMNPVRGLRGLVRPRLSRHHAALGPLADRHGAGLVDLTPRWRADPLAMASIPDGLHPDADAARAVIVEPVCAAIAAALSARPDCGPGGVSGTRHRG